MSVEATIGASVARQAARGDETAFARLVALYHADMARVAYVTSGGDADLAEDAVQAAWAIAWRKLGGLRDASSVRSWLVAVAANEARQLVRRRVRRTVVELQLDPPGPVGADPGVAIDRLDLVNALGRLKPEDRMLLALRYVAGLDSAELATHTGISPSGTRARLARLLTRLREDLDGG